MPSTSQAQPGSPPLPWLRRACDLPRRAATGYLSCLHAFGGGDADQRQPVGQYLSRRLRQRQSRVAQVGVVDQELVVVVVGLERLGEFVKIGRDQVWFQVLAGRRDHVRPARQRGQQLVGGCVVQVQRPCQAGGRVVRQAAFPELPPQAADARVRELHVVHRVVERLRARQVDVEGELRVRLAREQEPARRVAAGLVDQVAQREVAAGALGRSEERRVERERG